MTQGFENLEEEGLIFNRILIFLKYIFIPKTRCPKTQKRNKKAKIEKLAGKYEEICLELIYAGSNQKI